YATSIAGKLRRWRPDVLFIEQEPFAISAFQWAQAAHRLRIPFGVQAAENLDGTLPWPARAIRSFVLPHAAFVAARSPAAAELVGRWGYAGQVGLVPHAVPEWTTPERRARDDVFIVGFAGRLTEAKGLWDLVRAVRRLPGPVRLLLVGDGELRPDLARCTLPNG